MYYNHNLRADLQEWKNRLVRADYNQFGHQLKFFIDFIEKNKIIFGLITEMTNLYKYEISFFEKLDSTERYFDIVFENNEQQASYYYQLIKYVSSQVGVAKINEDFYFGTGEYGKQADVIVENIITPLIYYFHDKLDKSNSIIYLLEKYKRRVEWFTRKELSNKYNSAEKEYENLLQEDLRLFLFDQGIDFPFSTPESASGRSDIVGAIETDDPLIIEIKILDKQKKYGIERIKSGLHQIVKYTEDYSKDVGYLVIYNFDKTRYDFKFKDNNNIFPPMLTFNNKLYYFVTIDMYFDETASKLGIVEKNVITEEELLKN